MTTCKSAPARASGSSVAASSPGLFSTSRRQSVMDLTLMAMTSPPLLPSEFRSNSKSLRPRTLPSPRESTDLEQQGRDRDEDETQRDEESLAPEVSLLERAVGVLPGRSSHDKASRSRRVDGGGLKAVHVGPRGRQGVVGLGELEP